MDSVIDTGVLQNKEICCTEEKHVCMLKQTLRRYLIAITSFRSTIILNGKEGFDIPAHQKKKKKISQLQYNR